MAVAIAAQAADHGQLHLEVCPDWQNGACACPRDPEGRLETPHPSLSFRLEPPRTYKADVDAWNAANPANLAPALAAGQSFDHRVAITSATQFTLDTWARNCAMEALLLVRAQLAPPAAPAQAPASQVGTTL